MVAAEARSLAAGQQAAGTVPRVGTNDHEEVQRLQNTYQSTMLLLQNFQLGGPEKVTGTDDPRHALQENGGPADFWYLALVHSYLEALDTSNVSTGAERN